MTTETIPVARDSKEFHDLRERAAYVYATGYRPTHLRDHMQDLLAKVTRYSKRSTALDGSGGNLAINRTKVNALKLDKHPMVAQVREFVDMGFKIQARREPKARRPYGKVFLYRKTPQGETERVTVQNDGSVLTHW